MKKLRRRDRPTYEKNNKNQLGRENLINFVVVSAKQLVGPACNNFFLCEIFFCGFPYCVWS